MRLSRKRMIFMGLSVVALLALPFIARYLLDSRDSPEQQLNKLSIRTNKEIINIMHEHTYTVDVTEKRCVNQGQGEFFAFGRDTVWCTYSANINSELSGRELRQFETEALVVARQSRTQVLGGLAVFEGPFGDHTAGVLYTHSLPHKIMAAADKLIHYRRNLSWQGQYLPSLEAMMQVLPDDKPSAISRFLGNRTLAILASGLPPTDTLRQALGLKLPSAYEPLHSMAPTGEPPETGAATARPSLKLLRGDRAEPLKVA